MITFAPVTTQADTSTRSGQQRHLALAFLSEQYTYAVIGLLHSFEQYTNAVIGLCTVLYDKKFTGVNLNI